MFVPQLSLPSFPDTERTFIYAISLFFYIIAHIISSTSVPCLGNESSCHFLLSLTLSHVRTVSRSQVYNYDVSFAPPPSICSVMVDSNTSTDQSLLPFPHSISQRTPPQTIYKRYLSSQLWSLYLSYVHLQGCCGWHCDLLIVGYWYWYDEANLVSTMS